MDTLDISQITVSPTDLVILSVGMRPRQPETKKYHDIIKASLGLDGFFLERHPELAPVETAVEGVLLAGTIQGVQNQRQKTSPERLTGEAVT